LRKSWVEFQSPSRSGDCLRIRLAGSRARIICQKIVTIRQTYISPGVAGVHLDRLLKVADRFPKTFLSSLVPEITPLEIALLHVPGSTPVQAGRIAGFCGNRPEVSGKSVADLRNREYIAGFPVGFAQSFTEQKYVLRQIGLLHNRIRPDLA